MAVSADRASARTRSPARIFLVASGVWHLTLSFAGFALNRDFTVGAGAGLDSAHLLGFIETNGWHNLAGLLLGVTSLAFAAQPARARFGALALGWTMVGVTTLLFIVDARTLWLASNAWDQVLHAAAGIGGLVFGYATPRETAPPR